MPSSSDKQHRFMAAVANNPAFAKKAGVPQSVGEEFMQADKGRKFGSGSRADVQSINKPKTEHGKSAILARGGEMKESKAMVKKEVGFMKKAGAPKSMIKHEESEMKGMKKGGMAKKMARGGMFGVTPGSRQTMSEVDPQFRANFAGPYEGYKKGGKAKMAMGGGIMEKKGMTTAKMGKVVAGGKRAHGEHTIQQKGHTRGMQVKMAKGGKAMGGKC